MSAVTMREMFEAGVHFGHQTRFWNPKMEPYLYGQRNKIHIINLEKTLPMFTEAINAAGKLASRKQTILFVGTKKAAQKIIMEEATRCAMPYVNQRWLGGLLTNFKTVKQSINRLKSLEEMESDGSMAKMSKKEALMYMRELDKLRSNLSGIKDMAGIPQAIFIVDVGYESIAAKEARKLGMLIIGIVDSNNSPDSIDYPIPGNDDAIRSIQLYTRCIADAVLDARGSVAHLEEEGDADDFVELDEKGAMISNEKANKIKAQPRKKTVKQKAVLAKQGNAASADDLLPASMEDDSEIKATVEQRDSVAIDDRENNDDSGLKKVKAAKKKVVKKKTSKKKATRRSAVDDKADS